MATKPSDLLNVGTATFRRSSGFSLKISPKWLWKKDHEQALKDIRVVPVKDFERYFIFYRSVTEGIEIVRVLHGARDYASLF
ncbi:MAG: type II toxin-antitoxin system RelE/ParE family toxin [Patescibacteria group bacterium]